MGFLSTVQQRMFDGGKGLAIVATLSGLALGCSDSIDGVPACDSGHVAIDGQSQGRTISIDTSAKATASQNDAGGTFNVDLGNDSPFTLTWAPGTDGGDATDVSGTVGGIPGGPLCYGGDSQVEVGDTLTFHLAGLHACDSSSIILGEVFGCAGVTVDTTSGGAGGGGGGGN